MGVEIRTRALRVGQGWLQGAGAVLRGPDPSRSVVRGNLRE